MRWPPPFRSLPNPREVWAWGMFDLANQSFTLLIITVLFPIYFKEIAIGEKQRGDALWSAGISVALFIVVLLSPFVGAYADGHRARKKMLMSTGVLCIFLTASLALVKEGWGWYALLLFVPANILYQLGENLLASFLPSLSTTRTMGRVSAIGWTMGYAGGLMILVFIGILMMLLGWSATVDWTPFFVIAAAWFAIGIIPAALYLHEPANQDLQKNEPVSALARLKLTLEHAADYRQLVRFLCSFLIYGFGIQTMIAFAAIIARDFGISDTNLIWFTLQLTFTAGVTAIFVSRFQDRVGVRATIIAFLSVWMISATGLFLVKLSYTDSPPQWMFWAIGNGIGIGLGGIGTASRTIVGMFAPRHRTAEFYGLWGMTYKLSGAIGVLAFGQIKAWIGDLWAMGLLISFFGIGLLLFLRVDVISGIRAARRGERGFGGMDRSTIS
jgi:UMF1 family MFS transporter